MKFKVGDVIKIKQTDYDQNLPQGSIVKIRIINNDLRNPYLVQLNDINRIYCEIYKESEFEMATDREKFLCLLYGPHIPGVREWQDLK